MSSEIAIGTLRGLAFNHNRRIQAGFLAVKPNRGHIRPWHRNHGPPHEGRSVTAEAPLRLGIETAGLIEMRGK